MHKEIQKTIFLDKNSIGKRLDKAIAENVPEMSRSDIQRVIKNGDAKLGNGKSLTSASEKIAFPLEVTLTLHKKESMSITADDIPLDIIYEDDEIAVVNKPAGLTVHPGAGIKDGTLVNALVNRYGLEGLASCSGEDRPGIVHRIDKDTTGLLMIARTNAAYEKLKNDIKNRKIERLYKAILWGTPSPREGTIQTPFGRHPKNRLKMTVLEESSREAITHYWIESPLGLHNSLVTCKLDTGRTHQIRVHMAHIGTPVIGDEIYCPSHPIQVKRLSSELRDIISKQKRQALHAFQLSFHHPQSKEKMTFNAPLPADMQRIIDTLKGS